MLLTLEEEKYYEQYFSTFASAGWKQFIEEIQEVLGSHRIEDIKDEENLYSLKGERNALHRVVWFEDTIKQTYDTIKEREAEADA